MSGLAACRLACALALLTALGCGNQERAADTAPATDDELTATVAPAGFPAGSILQSAPADNPLTEDRARLGRRLFYETNLSRTGEVSCASCHRQENGFSDPNTVSIGIEGLAGT